MLSRRSLCYVFFGWFGHNLRGRQVAKSSAFKERSHWACLHIPNHLRTLWYSIYSWKDVFIYSFRGNPDSNAGEIQNACSLPQRDKCAVAPITASSNVSHIAVGMRREGGCLVQLRPDSASGAACLNPKSAGDERVQYDDLVLCYRATVCTK